MTLRALLAGATLLLAAGCASHGGQSPNTTPTVLGDSPPTRTQQSTGAALTLRQAIGQRMVFAYSGATPPAALKRRIARGEAAGVILFARNIRGVAALRRQITALQAIERPAAVDLPLLVMIDQEGGAVRRLPGPPLRGAADTPDAQAAWESGTAAGKLLGKVGVNVDLAPVLDVARPGSALEAEGRTYGRDPATVARRSHMFASGLRGAGVQPVYKHFPGFGAATINTDDGAARVDLPLATLRAVDLKPYKNQRPGAVMLSTAVYPRVDPRPAAFSRRWVTEELRTRLKYGDVVTLTDDLQAPAVTKYGSPAQLAFFAMRAGVDLPLFAKDYKTGARAAAGLEQAVRSGALRRADLDAGVRRVLDWRRTTVTGN